MGIIRGEGGDVKNIIIGEINFLLAFEWLHQIIQFTWAMSIVNTVFSPSIRFYSRNVSFSTLPFTYLLVFHKAVACAYWSTVLQIGCFFYCCQQQKIIIWNIALAILKIYEGSRFKLLTLSVCVYFCLT